MKIVLILFLVFILKTNLKAQVIGFESGIPTNWTTTNGGSLNINPDYSREGDKSLNWSFNGGAPDTLINDFPIITGFNNATTLILNLFSNTKISTNKFKVAFLNANNTVSYSFEFFQDFKGWYPMHIGYILHMRINAYSTQITKMRIISDLNNTPSNLLLDGIEFNNVALYPIVMGVRSNVVPSVPYRGMVGTIAYFTDTAYNYYYNQPRDIFATCNLQDSIEIDTIKNRIYVDLLTLIPAPNATTLATADQLYNWYQFSYLPNGDVKAKPIIYYDATATNPLVVDYAATPNSYEKALATFVGDFLFNNNLTSKNKAILMIKHIIRNGYQYGTTYKIGATLISYSADKLRNSLALMYKFLDNQSKSELFDLFNYQFTIGKIWDPNLISNQDSDEILIAHGMRMAAMVFFQTNYNDIKSSLLANKRYLNNYMQPMYGKNGISADGLGFHHDFHYNAYMYSFNKTNKSYLYPLRGTVFCVDTTNFEFYRNTMLTYMYLCNDTKFNPGMVGRHPQINYSTLTKTNAFYIADMEKYYFPPSKRLLSREYNKQWGTIDNSLLANGIANYKTGFIALNYSPAALYRFTKNGVNINASVKGLNKEFPGTEIFGNFNLFGRYQSYGNLFINYAGDKSGYTNLVPGTNNTPGWNWNMFPGTTSIHLPWDSLGLSSTTNIGYPFEYSDGKLAGALPHPIFTDSLFKNTGSVGVYGLEFKQKKITAFHDTSFAFNKSYFFFDNKILCLGSNIKNKNTASATYTNILQQRLDADTISSSSLIINGASIPNFPFNGKYEKSQNNWLIDRFNTGYLFLNNTDSLIIEKKLQLMPNQNNNGLFHSANYLTAAIKHGKAPTSSKYEYLVVPQATNTEMVAINASVVNNQLPDYTVVKQDSTAHAVFINSYNAISSVFFLGGKNVFFSKPGFPAYFRTDSQAIVTIKKSLPTQLDITMVNPVLNFIPNGLEKKPNPTPIVFTVPGKWEVNSQKGTGTVTAIYNALLNESNILFINKYALPIEFVLQNPIASSIDLNVIGNEANCNITCSWQNNAEQNIKYYTIEKSSDGILFDSITFFIPKNEMPNSIYNYKIIYPGANDFYRLKIITITGEKMYSNLINKKLNCIAAYDVNVFPNPVKDVFKVTIGTQQNQKITIIFYDIDGRLLTTSKELNLNSGINEVLFNANKFGFAKNILMHIINENGKQIAIKKLILQ